MSENNEDRPLRLALFAVIAAGLLPAAGAQAQYYGETPQPPLYPYAVQNDRPYAVEVAPNTYVIRGPATSRSYPYVGRNAGSSSPSRMRPRSTARTRRLTALWSRNCANALQSNVR